MKTYNMVYRIFKAMSLIAMSMILANCGKSDNGGGSTTTSGYYVQSNQCYLNGTVQTSLNACVSAPSTYYAYVGSQCYQIGNGIYQVAPSYSSCQYSNTTTQYQWINGQCYYVANGTQQLQSNTALCNTSNSGYGYGNMCNGLYTDGSVIAQCTEGVSGYSYSQISTQYGTRQVIIMDCSGYTLYQYNQSTGGYGSVVSCQ